MDVFAALADPTRRRMVELLGTQDLDAGELGSHFRLSQPAISQHLRVLREAGVVSARPQAQRRLYSLQPDALEPLAGWVDGQRRFWRQRLDALDVELVRGRRTRRTQ
jgi:DNA-binding transcriptional ArsR family regulator